jgi:sulfate adenylyltransferase subunit 1
MGAMELNSFEQVGVERGLLRFITAGSVDDGKSTLIGRLLYDSKSILEDQYSALASASQRRGRTGVDLSLLTDGLLAEREQGITIDVAYRYFATPARKFIIADSPGHEQYTRNMVTAASTAHLAVILLDARKGVLTQTRRHTTIAHLLGVRQLVFAVNKMDLVDYSQARFAEIVAELKQLLATLDGSRTAHAPHFVPMSALNGDNVVEAGDAMEWYDGPTLLAILEQAHGAEDATELSFRFPVQGIIRPTGDDLESRWHDFRGYSGRIEAGAVRVGDRVTVLPSGSSTTVSNIFTYDGDLEYAETPQSVTLELADDIDVSRGDLIVRSGAEAKVAKEISATVCWLSAATLAPGSRFVLRHGTRSVKAIVSELGDRIDINSGARVPAPGSLAMNDLGTVRVRLQQPLAFDPYADSRATGAFILVDEATNDTVAAGMIRD